MTDTDFRRTLDALIGKSTRAHPSVAPDPVNPAMIRHFADAVSDRNPVYTDPEFAAASRFGGIVALPAMLQTWTMQRPTLDGILERDGMPIEVGDNPFKVLDERGFIGSVATNSEIEVERYLKIGERVSATTVIEDISEEKQTAKGRGYFCTWVTTYLDDQGEVVGRERFRILKFRPTTTQ